MYPYRPRLLPPQVSLSGVCFLFFLNLVVVPPLKHLPRVWFNSWMKKCERKDLTELHLCWVIRLCVCLFTAPHSKLQLICIVWVNTAMNYSLWIMAQEPLSFFISFPSSSPLSAEYILNIKLSVENHPAITFPLLFFFNLHKWALWVILACWFFVLSLGFLLSYVRNEVLTAKRLSTADWPTYFTTADPYR